jgi:hypothetical protein
MSLLNLAEKPETVSMNLRDLIQSGDSSARPFRFMENYNLGNDSILLRMPIQTLVERSEVANERGLSERRDLEGYEIAQRRLDPSHATKLATYILKGCISAAMKRRERTGEIQSEELDGFLHSLGNQPYFSLQPLVANIRTCEFGGSGLGWPTKDAPPERRFEVLLSDRDVLWIIDGQHRRYGMKLLLDFLRDIKEKRRYPRSPKIFPGTHKDELSPREMQAWHEVFEIARTECTVAVEVHLGLDAASERQLFHDLNNLGKKVEASLAFEFDNSNPVNLFIKDDLVVREGEGGFWKPAIVDKDVVDWKDDPGAMTRKDMIAVNAILLLNRTNIKGAQPGDVEEKRDMALRFWEEINQIPGFGLPSAKETTVAAQPVVLKALAKLAYDFGFGKVQNQADLEALLNGIKRIDFSHTNPMWQYYQLNEEERERLQLNGLSEYLPSEKEGQNRDIGSFDGQGKMRFGAKHNDIYPIIGDMIRWRLKLPNRHDKE